MYEQMDGVAMGSPLGPLMANVFMYPLEEKLTCNGLMPNLYRRYIDDTLARMPNTDAATMFLTTLNGLHVHPSLMFRMELFGDDRIPFIGIEVIKNGTTFKTQVYRKSTNTGLLLHFHSHTDATSSLLKMMLHHTYALSSTTETFNEECTKLCSSFSRLDYPLSLIDSGFSNFDSWNPSVSVLENNKGNIVMQNYSTIQRSSFR